MEIRVGLLGLQGAIEEHEKAIVNAGEALDIEVATSRITLPKHLDDIQGIILPGGESTAMIKQGNRSGLLPALMELLNGGLPAFGTCAGAILLSQKVRRTPESDLTQGAFPVLPMEILRNGYGSQKDSFSISLSVEGLDTPFEGVFIRAPVISSTGANIKVLSESRGNAVFVEKDNVMATTFHPELTSDPRIHKLFLEKILKRSPPQ